MYESITLEHQEVIAVLTRNRSDRRNALSDVLLSDLSAALDTLCDNRPVRAVVRTATPPTLSAGADAPHLQSAMTIAERQEVFGPRQRQFRCLLGRVTGQLAGLEQPLICAMDLLHGVVAVATTFFLRKANAA